jgi:hypothetical protein
MRAIRMRAVHLVEPGLVHVERIEGEVRELARDPAVAVDLGEVAGPAEEAVGDARGAAAAPGELVRSLLVDVDADEAGAAEDDLAEEVGGVVVVPEVDPEPGAEGGREEALPRGRPDEGERREGEPHRPCTRAGVDEDVDGVVLHRGVEVLLHDRREPVDLVDEQDVPFLEVREEPAIEAGLSRAGPLVVLTAAPISSAMM